MIEYNYEILSVNKPANAMVVKFTANGHADYVVGTRMPYVGEQLVDVLNQYAPIAQWMEEQMEIADVEVGVSGTITPTVPEVTNPPEDFTIVTTEQQLIAQAEMQKQAIKDIVIEVLNEQSNTVPTTN